MPTRSAARGGSTRHEGWSTLGLRTLSDNHRLSRAPDEASWYRGPAGLIEADTHASIPQTGSGAKKPFHPACWHHGRSQQPYAHHPWAGLNQPSCEGLQTLGCSVASIPLSCNSYGHCRHIVHHLAAGRRRCSTVCAPWMHQELATTLWHGKSVGCDGRHDVSTCPKMCSVTAADRPGIRQRSVETGMVTLRRTWIEPYAEHGPHTSDKHPLFPEAQRPCGRKGCCPARCNTSCIGPTPCS